MKTGPQQRSLNGINYLYFGAFFLLLLLLSVSSIFTKESYVGSRMFFCLYAIGQITLEIFFFIFVGWMIRQFLGKTPFVFFIGFTFLCLILHLADFMMDRVLDLSIWETIGFILDESFVNFLFLLDASGIAYWIWILGFLGFALLPFVGFFLYKTTEWMISKKPFAMRREWFFQAFLCIPCALFFWDYSASGVIHPDAYSAFIKSLPWKCTFLRPASVLVSLPGPVKEPKNQALVAASIEQTEVVLESKPNIYLFVVESLREDFITAEVAPHLHQFKQDAAHFSLALSNGNGTHLSWFSIFHSQFPYLWKETQKKGWDLGSPALSLLKKWGYQIRLYTSAQLGYYGMDQLLFGKELSLLDHYELFPHHAPIPAHEADAEALSHLQKDIAQNPSLQSGQVFIVFWDSTHFDYSWPKNKPPKFAPFAKDFAYFKAFNTQKNIEEIKNRYRNSIHFMDSLFGDFIEHLPKKEEAIVIFTGDHGEEFYEHGHLFHNSHLTHEQTNIPLYLKFGKNERSLPEHALVSQMDIFPSVIDYLSHTTPSFLEGQSLFQKTQWPFTVVSRFNASRTPYEFCIHNGKNKLIAQFLNKKNVFETDTLQILSLRTCKDKSLSECKKEIEEWVNEEFGAALEHLFPPIPQP